MRAIASEIELPPLKPGEPNMFRCAAPGFINELYKGAGLSEVVEWDVPVFKVSDTPEEYWEMISEHASLAVTALKKVDDAAKLRIRERVINDVSAYQENGKYRVPGLARCIVGTK